jgi:hypothetical protein
MLVLLEKVVNYTCECDYREYGLLHNFLLADKDNTVTAVDLINYTSICYSSIINQPI